MPQDLSLDDWNRVMAVNLTSAFPCARSAHPLMVKAGAGKVVNIASILALSGAPNAAPYCASKGGMVQFTRSLALAWARDRIQVNDGGCAIACTRALRENPRLSHQMSR